MKFPIPSFSVLAAAEKAPRTAQEIGRLKGIKSELVNSYARKLEIELLIERIAPASDSIKGRPALRWRTTELGGRQLDAARKALQVVE